MLKISLSHIFSSVPSNRLSLLLAIFFYLCLSLFLSLISRPNMPEMRRLGQLNQSLGLNGKQQQNIQQNDSKHDPPLTVTTLRDSCCIHVHRTERDGD